ncbi:MAG: SGNH/GDSL hydrolase family protein [Jatrophihabitantaceae bacterium]
MRSLRVLLCLLLALGTAVVLGAPARGDTSMASPDYYVALGDSLSVGYQPVHVDGNGNTVPAGDTGEGYADDLYTTLHAKDSNLQLIKLGCSGETTATMIDGGVCAQYPDAAHSQLAAAIAFLTAHKANVKYLSLDIGANDVDGCTPGGSIDTACLVAGVGTITKNLNTILHGLWAADGGLPRSVGMAYYDPFLQYWNTGTQGKVVATASVGLLSAINLAEATEYTLYGFKVADVFAAFKTLNFSGALLGRTPVNVQTICDLTYMCTLQNIHATPAGYQLIAKTFAGHMS